MYIWIIFVVIAQLILATVALIDKYIVSKPGLPNPVVYAFYVNILSSASLIVLLLGDLTEPFLPKYQSFALPKITELTIPSYQVLLLSLVSGFVVLEALIFLFKAFRQADASDVVPSVSAVTAITTFVVSNFVFHTTLSGQVPLAIAFLILGTFLIAHFRCSRRVFALIVGSGFLFGIHAVMLKLILGEVNFSDGFFWTRIAGVLAAVSLLLLRSVRVRVFNQSKESGSRGGFWIIGNKTLAGIAGILVLAAINLGDVAVITALESLRFVFLILFTVILGRITPKEVGEEIEIRELIKKVIAVSLITIGFFMLFV